MELTMEKSDHQTTESYIKHSYLESRVGDESEVLFRLLEDDNTMIVRLNGYAVIPIEKYASLLERVGDSHSAWCYEASRRALAEKENGK